MNYPCEIIRDLLPLYIDEVCNIETKQAVEKHLAECKKCREYYEAMKSTDGFVENKSDNSENIKIIEISAKTGIGLPVLRQTLVETQQNLLADSDTTLVTNQRHVQALTDSRTSLLRVRDGLASGLPTDLAAQDIREAIYHLGSIVGEISTDEVLGNIFANFCIGK